ncbi:M56 family metallopeptidase [Salinimicrobium oceani]|uniref:M56 family metallopeptidase n=1 Tax=Salinimicrobium oceani TaxID=2722702 RepID=A0ABX1CXS4_9FLAO|nr:M56 family metallopeptidase [Salinimicrobium oceani]NJW53059.1 M56 family metallopeptidase [Salinimicrobium oceani]
MEMYIIKSGACLAILFLFYKLLLEKESFHFLKRCYLLAAIIASAFIPLVTFKTYVASAPVLDPGGTWMEIAQVSASGNDLWYNLLAGLYIAGVLIYGSRFLWNLHKIVWRIKAHQKVVEDDVSAVLLAEDLPPHTFWNYIFLNKQKFQKGQIPKEVYEHEKAHAIQRHTLDILLLEVLQIFLWFNPLIYMLKHAIKLNHEFLADRAVLERGANPATYQELLLGFSSGKLNSSLTNSINYSLIKKRFTIMKTKTNRTTTLFKALLLLPLSAFLLYSFSTKEVIHTTSHTENPEQLQEKATPKMVAAYNKWAKHVSENPDEAVEKRILERMKYIYSIMTSEQRKAAEEFPEVTKVVVIEIDEMRDSLATRKERREERAAIRREREIIKEDRKVLREDREAIRDERREIIIERRSSHGEVPPPPPPPPAPEVERIGQVPPPPPPPPSPVEAVKKWMEEGAEFFYNGKKIEGQEALNIVQEHKGKNLRVEVKETNTSKTVRLSDKKR